MKSTFYSILLVLLFFAAPAGACEEEKNCIEQSRWNLGIALGLGVRTNPLVDGDDIPNVLLLDVAWYGENAYFDNGELGYKWIESERFGLETYLNLDRERIYFSFWHPSNIFVNRGAFPSQPPQLNQDNEFEVSIDDIASRKWAINIGSRLHYYGDDDEWTFSVEADASSVHKGYKAAIAYRKFWGGDNWQLQVRPSLIWKSDNLIDYYYGISARDNVQDIPRFEATGGFQPSFSILYTRKINQNWQWILNASYQHLNSGMTDSPLVERDNIINVFVGAGYRF